MKNKGFTLIEVLLVMAITLILATGSYIGFLSFNRSQSLNIARDTLRNTLNEARSNAMSQVILRCNQNQTLVGHEVKFYTTYYDIEEVCRDVNPPNTVRVASPQIKRVPLSSDIIFNPNPRAPILFLSLTGGISDAANRTITLRSTSSQTRTVTVNPAGVISSN